MDWLGGVLQPAQPKPQAKRPTVYASALSQQRRYASASGAGGDLQRSRSDGDALRGGGGGSDRPSQSASSAFLSSRQPRQDPGTPYVEDDDSCSVDQPAPHQHQQPLIAGQKKRAMLTVEGGGGGTGYRGAGMGSRVASYTVGVHKAKKPQRARNVLILGKQHAGKSAFINTYRRAITGGDNWASAPVGRAATRGTDTFEPYYDQSARIGGESNVSWVLVDTAGRRFNKSMEQTPDEEELYQRMLEGMEWKTDLVDRESWLTAKKVPRNAIDHVVFVVPATDIITDNGVTATMFGRFEASLLRVKDLAARFAWWEKHLGNAPFVVVTHLDRMEQWTLGMMRDTLEQKLRQTLGQIVHSNRVFVISNPEDPADISPHTEAALKRLHRKIAMDIDARQSVVLKGRNLRWVSDLGDAGRSENGGGADDDGSSSVEEPSSKGSDDEVIEIGGGNQSSPLGDSARSPGGLLPFHSQPSDGGGGRECHSPSAFSAAFQAQHQPPAHASDDQPANPASTPSSPRPPPPKPRQKQAQRSNLKSKTGGGALLWSLPDQ
ncbi:GTP-binding protein [Diplonema papillatum]|nr:GTP-binding protein [Diplonema papillatum]